MTARRLFSALMTGVSLTALLSGSVGLAETGSNDSSALRQELDAVKTDLETIKKQLSEMHKQLAQRSAPAGPVTMSVGNGLSLGSDKAPVTIVEFSDYQCPFCKKHVLTTFPTLKASYIDTGKIRYVFRDFPLDNIHPYARKAAEAAHCARDQGKFWDMHDVMFQNQGALDTDNLQDYARAMQLDLLAFNTCLDEGLYAKKVEADVTAGSAIGVTGTPKFCIGKKKLDGTMVAIVMKGAQPVEAFSQVIDRLLEERTP